MVDLLKKETPGFLVDVDTGERLIFQFNPNPIVDDKSTHYAAIRIPGMSHPRYQFVAGNARRISFRLQFFKGPVKLWVDWLRALLYPEHAGTMLKNAPHRVLFFLGLQYPGLLCVVRQVRAVHRDLFDRRLLLSEYSEVDVVLEEYIDESIPPAPVRSGARP